MSIEQNQDMSQGHDIYKLWAGQEKPYFKENNLQEYEDSGETIRVSRRRAWVRAGTKRRWYRSMDTVIRQLVEKE